MVANEFKSKANLKISKLDALEMIKQEAKLFTGLRTYGNEKIEIHGKCNDQQPVEVKTLENFYPAKKCKKDGPW